MEQEESEFKWAEYKPGTPDYSPEWTWETNGGNQDKECREDRIENRETNIGTNVNKYGDSGMRLTDFNPDTMLYIYCNCRTRL